MTNLTNAAKKFHHQEDRSPPVTLVGESALLAADHVLDAEQCVLSAMIMEAEAIDVVRELDLRPGDLADSRHGLIFGAILSLHARGIAVDPVILAGELGPTLEVAGGKDYVGFLVDAAPTAANVRYHAAIVLSAAKSRALVVRLEQHIRSLRERPSKIDDVAKGLQQAIDVVLAARRVPGRFRLYSVQELANLPKHEDLIAGVIPMNALVGLIGAKGTMKTFVMLDLILHIALGIDWHGRKVRPGAIAYIYAEGPSGAEQRIQAWLKYYEYLGFAIDRKNLPVWFLPVSIPINDPGCIAELLFEIRKLPVTLSCLVVDTLNRNLEGDEDGKGMGGFVDGCGTLQRELGVSVIAVHHTPLSDGDRGRGHSSFDGALDTRLMVTRDDDRVTVECTHQRNGVDGWSVAYEAIPIAGSIVLKPSALDGGQLKGQRRKILELLHQKGTATYTSLLKESGLAASSFRKAKNWLTDKSYLRIDDAKYSVTDAGKQALGAPRAPQGHHD